MSYLKTNIYSFQTAFFLYYISFKTPFENAQVTSTNLMNDEKVDTTFTKSFKANIPLAFTNGEIDHKLSWYMGPSDLKHWLVMI
jgi:YidC/Oxa1 family membrane protein insertase